MAQKREPVIQVKNLYKIYRVGENKVRALNGVDLTIYRGEFCSIVGTSGSGGTHCFLCIFTYPADICLSGSLPALSPSQWRFLPL